MDKLINKFLTDKNHITMADCEKLLASNGYELRKASGSHQGYFRKGGQPIIIPRPHGSKYVKIEYVKLIIKVLNLEVK